MNPRAVICFLACLMILGCMPYVLASGVEPLYAQAPYLPAQAEALSWSSWSLGDPVVSAAKPEDIGIHLAQSPYDWSTRLKVGSVYEQLGLMNLAGQEYEQAVNLVGHNGLSSALPWQNMVRFKLRLQDVQGAQKWADVGRERFPREPALWELSIRLLMGQCAMAQAQRLADKALVLFPARPTFWQLKVLILMTQKDPTKVDACLRQAVSLFPNSTEILSVQGLVLLSRGKTKEALDEFERCIKLNPSCYPAYLLKASALHDLGRTAQMTQCYSNLFDRMPLDLSFTKTYLENLVGQKKFMEAFEPALVLLVAGGGQTPGINAGVSFNPQLMRRVSLIVKVALMCMPSAKADKLINLASHHFLDVDRQAQVYLQVGRIYDQLGRCHLAATQYRKALCLKPATSKTHLNLAQYLENQLLDYEGALSEYRQAFPRERQNMYIDNHIERLSRRLDNKSHDIAWSLKDSVRLFVSRNPIAGAVRLMVSN